MFPAPRDYYLSVYSFGSFLCTYIYYILFTKISKEKNSFFKLMIFIFLVNKCSSNILSVFKIPHLSPKYSLQLVWANQDLM